MLLPDLQKSAKRSLTSLALRLGWLQAVWLTLFQFGIIYISSDLYPSLLRTRLCKSTHAFTISLENSFDTFNAV